MVIIVCWLIFFLVLVELDDFLHKMGLTQCFDTAFLFDLSYNTFEPTISGDQRLLVAGYQVFDCVMQVLTLFLIMIIDVLFALIVFIL